MNKNVKGLLIAVFSFLEGEALNFILCSVLPQLHSSQGLSVEISALISGAPVSATTPFLSAHSNITLVLTNKKYHQTVFLPHTRLHPTALKHSTKFS